MNVSLLLSMTWLLELVKVDFKLIYMMYSSLECEDDMCEKLQGNMLGISLTR